MVFWNVILLSVILLIGLNVVADATKSSILLFLHQALLPINLRSVMFEMQLEACSLPN